MEDRCVAGDRLRTVMSSIMRRRRGLKSAISILLSEGGGLQHPHPLSQEAIYATLPLTPRQRLRSIPSDSLFEACALAPPHAGAAVYRQRHAGDEAGLVGSQEQGCVGDVPAGSHLLAPRHLGVALGLDLGAAFPA